MDIHTSPNPRQKDCVILLHGLARSPRSLKKLEQALNADYYVVNQGYQSRRFKISELAPMAINAALEKCRLHQGVNTIANLHGKVHFVTHSMGGILVRYYLAHNKIANLGHVVMLGPPNNGSELVDYFAKLTMFHYINGPAGGQLGKGKNSVPLMLGPVDYSVGIIAGDRNISPFYSRLIKGQNDGKVSVQSTKLDGMKDHLTLAVSHTYMMLNNVVVEQVKHFLENGVFKR